MLLHQNVNFDIFWNNVIITDKFKRIIYQYLPIIQPKLIIVCVQAIVWDTLFGNKVIKIETPAQAAVASAIPSRNLSTENNIALLLSLFFGTFRKKISETSLKKFQNELHIPANI